MFRVFYFLSVLITLIVYLISIRDNYYNLDVLSFILIIDCFSLVIFLTKKEKILLLKKQYFKHSYIILLSFLIVNYQYPLDFVLGNVDFSNRFLISKKLILFNVLYSSIGLHSFFIGYLINIKKNIKYKNINKSKGKVTNTKILDILLPVFLIGYLYTVNPLYLSGLYGSVEMGTEAGYFSVALMFFFNATFIQQSLNLKYLNLQKISFFEFLKKLNKLSLFTLIIYLFTVLISGDRGPILYSVLLLISCYLLVTKKKFSFKYLILFLFMGATIVTTLGIIRDNNLDGTILEKIEYSFERKNADKSISVNTRELAGSYRTLSIAIDNVPNKKHDYFFGLFQFKLIASSVPYISTIIGNILDNTNYNDYTSSADFITKSFSGNFPSYGLGSSVIADLYLDFGLFGVIIGMFTLGYCVRYAEVVLIVKDNASLFIYVFSIVYFCSAIYLSRSMLLQGLPIVMKTYLILLFNDKITKKKT